MKLLKQTMLDTVQRLSTITEQIACQKFLSEQDFLCVLGVLDQLRKEQKRCLEEMSVQTGMDLHDCTSVELLEQRLAEYQKQRQRRIREEAVLSLADRFGRITGESDYGFALEPFQTKLMGMSVEELLAMDEAGELDNYRLMLELIPNSKLTPRQVEPIGRVFNFHIAFGLLGGKYVCMKTEAEPEEAVPAEPEPKKEAEEPLCMDETPIEATVPELQPLEEIPHEEVFPEELSAEKFAEAPLTEEVQMALEIPLTELPTLVIDGAEKRPKGESAFVSIWRKSGQEQAIALEHVAYMILDNWGCRKSLIHQRIQKKHSAQVIDRAIALLVKEGFLNSYRLEGENAEDPFYNATKFGHQILSRETLQRRVRGKVGKYGYPDIANAGVFMRLSRMNEVNEILDKIPNASITRTLERGFCGELLCPERKDSLCHFPMLYTCADTREDICEFLAFFKDRYAVTEQTAILLEVPEGQQKFWREFFAREFSSVGRYYVSAWKENCYEDGIGNMWTTEELLARYMPQKHDPDEPGQKDYAQTVEETESSTGDLTEREVGDSAVDESPVELEQIYEVEQTEENAPQPLQTEIAEECVTEIEQESVVEQEVPAMQEQNFAEEEPMPNIEGLSSGELARMLAKLSNPDENPEALLELIYRLVAEGQTMEALVLAKAITNVSKDMRFQKIYRDLLHGSNLPLQERDYSGYVIREDNVDDSFGRYSLTSAAFWAACFPKMAYDHALYLNISTMVESQMDLWLPAELVSIKNAMSCLTGELKEISFDRGDGAGLSAAVLDSLTSGTVQEDRRKKLMLSAKEKLNAPHSNISITGLEALMRNIMGPTGELGLCMKVIAEDNKAEYTYVKNVFDQFTKEDGTISDRLLNAYIDNQWDNLRNVKKDITLRRFDNESPARKAIQREISKRLENMDEWLKRNSSVVGGSRIDQNAFRAVVGRIGKNMTEAVEAIAALLPTQNNMKVTAGLQLLRHTLLQIMAIIRGDAELVQEPKDVFAKLLTTQYPVLDANGEPVLTELLNELPGMEPWKLLLQHISSEKDTLEEALQKIEDHELRSSRYEDYGSAVIIRSVLGLSQVDHFQDDCYAKNGCMDQEETFMGDVRLACAYGQLAEEDKETIFAQLGQYRNIFVPASQDDATHREENHLYGNYAHYRMMIECLKVQVNHAKAQRKEQFWQFYEERTQHYRKDRLPSMLKKVRQELENDNLATAEEYLTRFDAGVEELPQESVYAAEFDFHRQYLECADWYCDQCEKPENKNMKPKDWGRRVLQNKNFWSASNEKNSAESILENWPTRKGDGKNPAMLRMFLSLIGLPVQQVFPDDKHPATSQYEVFVAGMKPVESGREDYSHPVAKFGTLQEQTMYIVCLYGCKGSATLIDIMTKKLQLGGNTIVVMDGVVNVLERRRVAAEFKSMTSGQNGFLLIDRVLMLYLAAQDSGNRLNAMLQCTMPYIYEQLYTEGAGTVADEMFMGRIAERKSLCDPNGACLVYGGRQLGKTALLRRVESINNKPADQRYAIYVDIKEMGRTMFIQHLRDKLLTIQTDRPLLRGDEQDLEQICASLQRNKDLYRQLTILIDEVDVYFEEIAPNNYNDIHPVVVLQDEVKNKVKFVFAGTHNVAATAKAIEDNADIIKLRQPLCIKPLSSADARQLIRWPLSYLGFEIGEQQIAMILANTNSYPGLIHLFCNSLVKSICDNYSKYYGANKGNPPYTVSDEQLRTIFREKDIKREIANRVIATIKVNTKYRVVANLIAFLEYQDQENGTTRLYGFTPEEVQMCNAREFCIYDFMPENISLSDLDTLMEEMEKMGILWKNPKTGSYRFRQRDFLGYIGNSNQVMNTLLGGV